MPNKKYKKSITAEDFLKKPSSHFYHVTHTKDELNFNVEEVMSKYNLKPTDISHLVEKIGYLIEANKKKDLLRLIKRRFDLLTELEKNKIAIATNDKRIGNEFFDIKDNHILEEKKQINAIISGLGIQEVTEEHRNNALKDLGQERGMEMIFNAEHKVKSVGYMGGSASVRLKKKYNPRMTYTEELLTLAMFWIPLKGPIPKTEGNNFYLFCSDILSTQDKIFTSGNAFGKFKNDIVIEYIQSSKGDYIENTGVVTSS